MTLRVIVSDSSCLIDLRKASLTEAFLALPFEIVIPDVMLMDELLSFSDTEKEQMQRLGLTPQELDGPSLRRAGKLRNAMPALTIYDCFAYVLAENNPKSVLFTSDQKLRTHAESHNIEVHGLLWGVEQMEVHSVTSVALLVRGLQTLSQDPTVRVPSGALADLIRRLNQSSR